MDIEDLIEGREELDKIKKRYIAADTEYKRLRKVMRKQYGITKVKEARALLKKYDKKRISLTDKIEKLKEEVEGMLNV